MTSHRPISPPISHGLARLLRDTEEQSKLPFRVRGFTTKSRNGCGFPKVYDASAPDTALDIAKIHERIHGPGTAQIWRGDRMLWPTGERPMNERELREYYGL